MIYVLQELKSKTIFYVGSTLDPHKRLLRHRCAGKQKEDPIGIYIDRLWQSGDDFELIKVDDQSDYETELYYIKLFSEIFPLVNQNGIVRRKLPPKSQQQVEAQRKAMLGRTLSVETKMKISEAASKRVLSPERKRKMSETMTRKYMEKLYKK